MQIIESFNDLQRQVVEIRSLRLGFITNFFPDIEKHSLWIEKRHCFTERINDSLFIIKKSNSFWSVFYCSTTMEELGIDLSVFHARYPKETIVYDLVGRDVQCSSLVELFKASGCHESTSLVRMTRMTVPIEFVSDSSVRYAVEQDLFWISEQLHKYFEERTEQIPFNEELEEYIKKGHVLVCEEDGQMAGFLIYDLNATTLYLRYWFTSPEYRDRKVGSRLFRRSFEEGKDTKRQILWVIRTNENAIVRYYHYGFFEENMYDFVMQHN